jgi:hypothetical protein
VLELVDSIVTFSRMEEGIINWKVYLLMKKH